MKANKNNTIFQKLKRFFQKNKGIIITVLISGLAFVGIFKASSWSSNIHNMGGTHSWLSGSTIKFVNNWLKEGAINLKFTNYEDPASIEFETLEEREPYLSYPSGETFFVYAAAKVFGKQQITVSFLHKFQIIMFGIEAILLASFIYYFLSRTLKLKSELEKILISGLTSILWVVLPICSYYLPNIYYADQCVILWAMVLILIEYLFRTGNNKNTKLKILRSVVLYSGVLIDYYFWFIAFMLFISEIFGIWLGHKKGDRKKKIFNVVCWFGAPVILALLTYYIQLTLTDGWLNIMIGKFNERVVGSGSTTELMFESISNHFSAAFTLDGKTAGYLIAMILVTAIGGMSFLIMRKKAKKLVTDPGASIIIASALAIILQIYFFKQHSAIHEFSMLKVGWLISILPLLIASVSFLVFGVKDSEVIRIGKTVGISGFFVWFLVMYMLVLITIGVPMSTERYSKNRIVIADYSLEVAVNENTDYNDVVFSYTKEIPINPPQSLAISKKRIYKVKNVKEIAKKMSGLNEYAQAVLLIEKDIDMSEQKGAQLKCLKNNGDIIWDDENLTLVKLKKYDSCWAE